MQMMVQDSDYVKDVKMRLKKDFESLAPFKLVFFGAELPDNRTMYSLRVGPTEEGSPCLYCVPVANFDESSEPGMVKVINLSGGHVMLPASESHTLQHLKDSIARSLSLPVDRVRLLHRGLELKDEMLNRMSDLGLAGMSAPIYVLERPSDQGPANDSDCGVIHPGAMIERRIDCNWFPAKILRIHAVQPVQKVDIKYLDDSNIELGVDWSECRWLEGCYSHRKPVARHQSK
eukprot:Skav213551  [mRNA]  locus=scaffold263:57136:57831:+ [translate_table: standard]